MMSKQTYGLILPPYIGMIDISRHVFLALHYFVQKALVSQNYRMVKIN